MENNPIVIANNTVKEYLWITVLRLLEYDEVTLHAIDPYMATVDRLVNIYSHFGIYAEPDSRKRIETVNVKNGNKITVNEIKLVRSGRIK